LFVVCAVLRNEGEEMGYGHGDVDRSGGDDEDVCVWMVREVRDVVRVFG
jgi:hypothetical protein